MELMTELMNVLVGELPFLLLAIFAVMAIGFPVADKLMTRGTSLSKALFEDDNPAAGLEVGGIFLALLFVSYNAISGEAMESLSQDVMTTAVAIVLSIVLIAVAREVLGVIVKGFNGGKDLNDEIFNQRNMAAAAVSLSITMAVVNGLTEENSFGETPVRDGLIALAVTGCGLISILLYKLTHLRGASFLQEFFADDNPAAGISLLGFAFAANFLVLGVTDVVGGGELDTGSAIMVLMGTSIAMIIILGVLRTLLTFGINKMLSTNLQDELFEQNNVGAGFIDAGMTIGCALLLASAIG